MAGKKQNIDPMWKELMRDVDLGEPTSFFDHVYLGRTQRECETSKDIVDNERSMFESRISAGAMEKLSEAEAPGKPDVETVSLLGPMTWKVTKKCVERYSELANKTTEHSF